MSYYECDACGTTEFTEANPFVEVRTPRPSDPSGLCCIIAGCLECFPGSKTPEQWSNYIESDEAAKAGYYWLT